MRESHPCCEKHHCFYAVCYRFSIMCATARKSKPAVPAKLPRGGRHPLTQQAVAASQRARMLAAVARVVADKGYATSTVADVIALAGVSRRTFYEQFAGIDDCFVAAYESGMRALFAAIRDALRQTPTDDWRERTRIAIDAYLRALAAMPDATWAFSIEALGANRKALEYRSRVIAQWVAQWRALQVLREHAEPRGAKVSDAQLLALVGGIEELVRGCLQRRGAARLPQLADEASAFALKVLGAVNAK